MAIPTTAEPAPITLASTTRWPAVKAWLVTTIPTLPGLSDVMVFPGQPVTGENPDRYVTVGYVANDIGGTYQRALGPSGFEHDESGEVRCQIVAQSGETDPTIAEQAAFAVADAVEAAVRADRTLGGVLSPASSVESVVEVTAVQNAAGSAENLVFAVRYTTTTL